METSETIKKYFDELEKEIQVTYKIGTEARKKGFDPEEKIDIPLAKGISERVEGLISAAAPQILHSGVAQRIQKLEKEYGVLDWRICLKIAEEVAKQKFCKFKDEREAMEVGIRTGLAYITLGVIAAPLEGFIELKIKTSMSNKKYLSCFFAGPIRAAGGTATALTVIIADYVRLKMGYDKYDAQETEIKRFQTEVQDYHERVTNLQYLPSPIEIDFLIKNIAIEINGDPTEKIEVSNYKDLARVETNRIRGGVCLVVSELAQKAPKLYKNLAKWGREVDLNWDFMKEFLEIQKKVKARGKVEESKEYKLTPNFTYIKDLVAGRPVLTHPLRNGGFRLRYGRTRMSGFAADGIHPITMYVLNKYLATGTQLKVERPGKATVLTPCDYIEGPIVKLLNGNVLRLETEQEGRQYANEIKEFLYLGDLLVNYGDFSENNHKLVPAGYCEEWWIQELEKATVDLFGTLDLAKLSELIQIKEEHLELLLKEPIKTKISARAAINISDKLKIPLHPYFTFYWNTITTEEFLDFYTWIRKGTLKQEDEKTSKLILPYIEKSKRSLELLGVPHIFFNEEFVIIEKEYADILVTLFSISAEKEVKQTEVKRAEESKERTESETVLEMIVSLSGIKHRDKAGTFIGARMGRPEKAKMRKLTGSPHILFPVGNEGGRLRCFQAALEKGKITADFPMFKCTSCNRETIFGICETCGKKTQKLYYCNLCGMIDKKCDHEPITHKTTEIDINHIFESVLKKINTKSVPDLIKGVRGTSNKDHTPEHLIKGILRAKHSVYVNKDGTTRYDMTELPITHFKAKEVKTSVERLKELGYLFDIEGKTLETEEQVLELFPQDVILPACPDSPDEGADVVLFRTANFLDELLVKLYDSSPFYKLETKQDIVGHLIIGLAPHTSAGTVGRVIGFSKTQGMLCHPMFHAAMRRNCDGDEACSILLMDAVLNFSRSFLPDKRGSRTMDAPLVLTSVLIPSEVDDEVHGLDRVWRYPLDLYEAGLIFKNPSEVQIQQLDHVLGTEKQYQGFGYTHKISSINSGNLCSAYKTLVTMEEKLKGQMDLAEKIRAVDENDVARLVIEKHLLRDIRGNLRKFSMQQFRCSGCNEKFRRPPLIGKCTKCGGKIIFTISEGSIIKYLEPSISLAKKYNLSTYLKQSLELTKRMIEDVFGKEKEKQIGLGSWF
jgi:DNA polymerase II large subunit